MRRRSVFLIVMFAAVLVLAACAGDAGPAGPPGPAGPAGPQGPAGAAGADGADASFDVADLSCAGCHDDAGDLLAQAAQLAGSHKGTGGSYVRGARANCAGCHGSQPSMLRIREGLQPHDESIEGVAAPAPFNCRSCHEIHLTGSEADWALEGGGAAVDMEYTDGTFDAGAGNLCAQCHQIRNEYPTTAADGTVEITTTRFGTHHGAEANMLLGAGGAGVEGSPAMHYQLIEDGCTSCHMGEGLNHAFEPDVANCQGCHADLDTFDLNGTQTEIQGLLDQIQPLLIASGIMNEENRSIEGTYPEEVVQAMWNYIYVIEDQSMGVHNPGFARALLQYSLEALGGGG